MNILWALPITFLVGCAHQIEYVPIALELPDRPTLPTINRTEFERHQIGDRYVICIGDDAYIKLVQRERIREGHIEVLEAIIKSTQDRQ